MTVVPPRILAKLRSICLGLADAYEEAAWVGTRWMIRKRNFAHVVRIEDGWPPAYARAAGTDGPSTVLTFRTTGLVYDALRTTGPPFFHAAWGTRWGTKVIGRTLDGEVDWNEVTVLLTESYRLLAPKKLAAAVAPVSARVTKTPRRPRRRRNV